MSLQILNQVSGFEAISNDFLCFICSSNRASHKFSNIFLTVNGIKSTDVEKRKIVSVLCQLLRVKWDGVKELFIDNVHFPFCEKCSKSVIDIIGLREQLLQIELNIREKIRKIATTITHNFKSEDSEKMNKFEKEKKKSYSDYRQNFQYDVMEEYLNKNLVDKKIPELKQAICTDLSLVELDLSKYIFQIGKYSDDNMSIGGDSVTILSDSEELDKKKTKQTEDSVITISDSEEEGTDSIQTEVSLKPHEPIVKIEAQLEIPKSFESEYILMSLDTLPTEEFAQIGKTICSTIDELSSVLETDGNAYSDEQRKDPDYELPRKKSRLDATSKNRTKLNKNMTKASNTVREKCVTVAPEAVTTSEASTEDVLVVHCICSPAVDSFILTCKFCGKKANPQEKKPLYVAEADTPNCVCPFCPAKFWILNELREHARTIHFPIPTPAKCKQSSTGDISGESGSDVDDAEDDAGGIENDTEVIQEKDLYDADEMMDFPSEGDGEPILSAISSESSSSDEEVNVKESTNKTSLVTPIRSTPVKRSSPKKGARPGTKSVTTVGTMEVTEYVAKDRTIWTTLEPPKTSPRAYSIPREDGKVLGRAADTKLTPVELFKLMFSPDIVDLIVKYTNIFGSNYIPPPSKSPQGKPIPSSIKRYSIRSPDCWKPTYNEEIYAFIGMVLYFGLEKKAKSGAQEAWNKNGKYTVPCIAATMPRDRFQNLTSHLRFDDWVARRKAVKEGLIPEKLSYISEIFNPFVTNLQSYLRPYDSLVVDEMLIKFRGTSKFRVYMKSKPGKYGIKIWACCDTKTGYILRLIIYEGKEGDKVATELGKKVVLALVEKYFGSGRGVTTDNFFTSKALAHELMEQNMSLLGTLNKNRMDIIPEFIIGKGREIESSIFAFQNDLTMVSYVPRKNKTVLLLSTQHHHGEVNPETKNKPTMILDYNKTKGAVDTADFMITNYSCQRVTNRWPMKLFYAMCDIGALNAYHIWKIHQRHSGIKVIPTRLTFLRMLSEALMEPVIRTRAQNGERFTAQTKVAMKIMGFSTDITPPEPTGEGNTFPKCQGRCDICVGHKRQTRTRCHGCHKKTCNPHSSKYSFCPNCNPYAPGGLLNKNKKVTEPIDNLAIKDLELYKTKFGKNIDSGKDLSKDLSKDMKQVRSRNHSVPDKKSPKTKTTSVKKGQPKASPTTVKKRASRVKASVVKDKIRKDLFPSGSSLANKKVIDEAESESEVYDLM